MQNMYMKPKFMKNKEKCKKNNKANIFSDSNGNTGCFINNVF